MNRRNLLLGAALLVTLGLVAWVDRLDHDDGDLVLTKPARAPRTAVQEHAVAPGTVDTAAGVLAWQRLEQRLASGGKAEVDLFKAHSWYVPPPPKPAEPPPPPPRPVAPPAPFTYMGKMEDTPQGTLMLLSGNNKVYTLAVGETLDKIWRIDGEDNMNVRLTYLPLGLPQVISKIGKAPARSDDAAKPEPKKTENQGNDV